MPSQKLLCIANHPGSVLDQGLSEILSGFCVIQVTDLTEALIVIARENVGCVLVTGEVPDFDPVDALEVLRTYDSKLPVVFWEPGMKATVAVRLIRAGADHCFGAGDCPTKLRDQLEVALEERQQRIDQERAAAANEPWMALLVGESLAMKTVAETIRLIGPRRCTVLISGETGTGKEMAARALHMSSPRANLPMVAINCSALPENLLEAELFGHVKGAFTGAVNNRVGRFEQANKSTLFLDEIGDMPLELQAKLLRVLQDREVQRLGSSENIKVDVRVIAASNMNLLERVRQGKFREDLYYRLNVVPLKMPSLNKRQGDIALLAPFFVQKVCLLEGVNLKRLTPETLNRLCARQWPGNVRELENSVEMAVAMSGDRELLYPADFGLANSALTSAFLNPGPNSDGVPDSISFETAVNQFERNMLDQALRRTAGNKTAAAELLGMKRTTLIMKLRSLDAERMACAV